MNTMYYNLRIFRGQQIIVLYSQWHVMNPFAGPVLHEQGYLLSPCLLFLYESNNPDPARTAFCFVFLSWFGAQSTMNTELFFKLARALVSTISALITLTELTTQSCIKHTERYT